MKAKITWREGVYFEGAARGHTIAIEGPEDKGGKNRGMRPMEAVLIGLGACSAYDVMNILHKTRQQVARCEVELDGERTDQIPAVFRRIRMHFRCSGQDLDPKRVAQAVSLSVDKYCSVAKMLNQGGVKVEHSFSIVSPDA